ncbi:TrmB family transcriptional regulator [Bryobacter aggregatus]|uniref:TrmB family transcriptional regulator n=1 Tax=Bryobacter aggregatus TaxID=360054 RepID=UPI001EE183E6|nr:helix-turn-helix domain-containing protein [Bryobacter aggregatus]
MQQIGLNAYESRSYLVLLGHTRFKALELAARAQVPRQKIYEVLDSLVEKGFAHVVQERTKLFSAVEPTLALRGYLNRREESLKQEIEEQSRNAVELADELSKTYAPADGARGNLDYLRIVSDPSQTAKHYRLMLQNVKTEYIEFSRPPYAVDPLDERLVRQAIERGVKCRLLIEQGTLDATHRKRLEEYAEAGVEVRESEKLPMKLAVFDNSVGLVALLDPVLTRPTWTAVVFEHPGFAEAMHALFHNHWKSARKLD